MNLCKDCQYFQESNYCSAPQNGSSPVDGKPKVKFASVSRNKVNECGLGAKYWVRKSVVKPWWKFWS